MSRSGTRGPRSPERQGPGGGVRPIAVVASAAFLLLALVAGWAEVVRVGAGERVFRLSGSGGNAERLAPGWHLALPGLQRLWRVPAGAIHAAGRLSIRSREGVALELRYEGSGEIGDAALAALLSTRSGPDEILRREIAAAIRSWSEGSSGEALVLRQGASGAVETARQRLEGLGFESVSVRIGGVEGPADVVASIAAGALRDRVSDTKTKIAILGLDGADWQIIDPLIAKGQLPNLARLKARGAWGNMKSMFPMLSPLLWTSVATGMPPEAHGIIDFLVKDAKTGRSVPVSSRWRKVKALWNIFTDAGKTSAFVGWWATWPAEPVNGYMVSDRVAYSLFGYEAEAGDRAGATSPPGYFQEIRPKITDDASIPLREVQQFVSVTPAEFAALRARIRDDPKGAYRLPVNHLTKILASARSYQAIGLDLLSRGQPDLFSVYYQGIDEVCHRFAHYMPPKMAMVTQEEYGKYHDAVFAYYRSQDRLLGEMLAKLSPDTTVIVLSDHGFRNGSDRPPNDPPYIEGKPGLWHRRYGIVIFAGPAIRPGPIDTTSLLDVAPTVLYLAGLPVAEDMPGRVVREAIDERFASRFPVRTIPSYEGIGAPLEARRDVVADSGTNTEMLEKLRSLGYIGAEAAAPPGRGAAAAGPASAAGPAGGEDQKLVTGYMNEAGLQIKNKDYDKAAAAVAQALKIQPGYPPGLTLSVQIDSERKRYGPAIETARKVLDANPDAEPGLYLRLGRAYAETGRTDEGLAYLDRMERERPRVAEIHSALGSIRVKRGETGAAEKEFLEALRLDPALSEPLTALHTIYQGTARVLSLEPLVRKGLEINEKSVVHHNWMGFIHEWKKEIPRAEAEFRRAIELDPDDPATLANLGALYGRAGRLNEAVEVLTRAVAKEPDNKEAWVNLGAAQGRLRHPREAIEALETARRQGVRSTTLFNALALAYLQDHNRDKALEYLKESLAIDPSQKDAPDLMKAVSSSS